MNDLVKHTISYGILRFNCVFFSRKQKWKWNNACAIKGLPLKACFPCFPAMWPCTTFLTTLCQQLPWNWEKLYLFFSGIFFIESHFMTSRGIDIMGVIEDLCRGAGHKACIFCTFIKVPCTCRKGWRITGSGIYLAIMHNYSKLLCSIIMWRQTEWCSAMQKGILQYVQSHWFQCRVVVFRV